MLSSRQQLGTIKIPLVDTEVSIQQRAGVMGGNAEGVRECRKQNKGFELREIQRSHVKGKLRETN